MALSVASPAGSAQTRDVLRGVNFVHPLQFSVADQDSRLAKLQSLGVRVIRFGLYDKDEEKNVDFIKRAHTHGIAAVLILHGLYAPDAPQRPYRPQEFPGMWSGPPLSYLDPARSARYFRELLEKLESDGIVLAGMELENEINMAGNNPDFRLPGEGRVLGLADLTQNPEGRQVAKGYLQYLKVLAALKAVRDHSKLNQHTPLLPTSLVDLEQEGPWPTPKPYDGVSIGATMAFFRAHGLDALVDAYNLHTYPWGDSPGDKAAAIHRLRRLKGLVDPICSPSGKPCWITEWGFSYASKACSGPEETAHTQLVQEMMGDFRQLAQEGRLAGLIYYSWTGDTQFDVDRCGRLTDSGKASLSPMR
ncbi:glycoside hydrolase family protein [Microbacteriaceae bacterium K1510]|nr:glycoside hydrolase family protein [Microbacteriaceae bacterium K1510]